jgi:iron complex transport system substrate-binding protein
VHDTTHSARVSAFTSANIDKILALGPDLVLTISDLQADIAGDLIRRGINVHAFNQRSVAEILALGPALVLTFSDLQADIAGDLIRRGINVHAFNQRSAAEILEMIRMLGAMVDASERAEELVGALEAGLAEARKRADNLTKRPRYSSKSGTIR